MRHLFLLCLPLLLFPATAQAAGWESGMVEDEGGPVMQAWVEGEGGDVPPELRMMCGDGVMLRYGFGSGPGEEAALPDTPQDFAFDFGDSTITLSMQLEEMDGMFAAYFPASDPVIAALKSAASVTVNDPTGVWHPQAFPLTGSSRAIDAVLKTCG